MGRNHRMCSKLTVFQSWNCIIVRTLEFSSNLRKPDNQWTLMLQEKKIWWFCWNYYWKHQCDMIMGNQSDVADIGFFMLAKKEFKLFCLCCLSFDKLLMIFKIFDLWLISFDRVAYYTQLYFLFNLINTSLKYILYYILDSYTKCCSSK